MSSSGIADTWILLENQKCFLLCHLCCYILILEGKVLWRNDSCKPQRSGGWESGCAVLMREKKQLIIQKKNERKVQEKGELHSGFPVLWAVPCLELLVLGADHSQHLLVKRFQFTGGIKVARGVVTSVRQREMHINPLHWAGRERSVSLSPASCAVPHRGAPGKWQNRVGHFSLSLPLNPAFISNFQQHNLRRTDQERSFPTAKCFTLGWTQSVDQITTNLFSLQRKGLTLLQNLQINHNSTDLLQSPSTRGTQCFGSIFILSWFLFPYVRVGWGRVWVSPDCQEQQIPPKGSKNSLVTWKWVSEET